MATYWSAEIFGTQRADEKRESLVCALLAVRLPNKNVVVRHQRFDKAGSGAGHSQHAVHSLAS